jgi:hypothetical protein
MICVLMTDLSARSAKLATILGRISLGLTGLSAAFVVAGFVLGFRIVALSPIVALAGLMVAVWALLVRRACLNPRPESPALALAVSVVACCIYGYWAHVFMGLGGMH